MSTLQYRILFESIFNKVQQGIVILQDWMIVNANPKMSEIVGIPREDLIGMNAQNLIPEERLASAISRYAAHCTAGAGSGLFEDLLQKKDGSEIGVEVDLVRTTFDGKTSILAIITDLTATIKAEEELQSLRQYQSSLIEHINIWVNVLDPQGNVVTWNKAAEEISGYSKDEVIGHSEIWNYLYPDRNYRNWVFSKAMQIIQNGETTQGLETIILTKDKRKKIISWFSRNLLDNQGNAVGSIAIGLDITEIKYANEALEQANNALSAAYDETIEGWSRALDLRDRETEGHSRRVTQMTVEFARMAGMSEDEIVHVRRGALLHDIGKFGVPDSILLKKGELTESEWIIMKKHPELAYEVLYPIQYLRPALDIPYYHHERWDGSGYPFGLEGEEIPLAARLFAVADIWDALRSDRPYRKAWSEAEALNYIKSLGGTKLDSKAVEYFLILQGKKALPI
jgi:PAS domain S-box-containing protein